MTADKQTRILGWIHIAVGGLGLLAGTALCIDLWLSRDADGGRSLGYVGPLFLFISAVILVPGLVGGIGLVRGKVWGRGVILVVSVFHVANLPIGTALGVFGLWTLLRAENRRGSVDGEAVHAHVPILSNFSIPRGRYLDLLLAMVVVAAGFAFAINVGFWPTYKPAPDAVARGAPVAALILMAAAAPPNTPWFPERGS
jgi:hypothetical protein